MGPPKPTKKTKSPKEKVFHPLSRKAGQLVRTQLRKGKLTDQVRARNKKHGQQVDIYSFFYHAIPPEGVLSLEDLHMIIRDVWLPRHDDELEAEKTARRKGRPKSTKEQKLEEIKLREADEYRTGLEVIDLTDLPNVQLLRKWDLKEVPYVQQLRFIRISSTSPDTFVVSRVGKHPSLRRQEENIAEEPPESDARMDVDVDTSAQPQTVDPPSPDDEVPLLLDPSCRFGSTMLTMDGPLV